MMGAGGALGERVAPTMVLSAERGGAHDTTTSATLGEKTRALTVKHDGVRHLLTGIAEHSPFLWSLAQRDPERLDRILGSDPDEELARVLTLTQERCKQASDADVRAALRQARNHVALLIALADLGNVWPLRRVTDALTTAAETFVRCAVAHQLRIARESDRLASGSSAEDESGLIVLALGKLGAGELNYSSDIDLVVFYDPSDTALADGVVVGPFYVRLTQGLARLLSDRTEDGYVARVDLRLRPDPGSTPVAISVPAALTYYETLGQNWERAAFIKARTIAGAIDKGVAFLRELEPFIWRRYFDYAAIADIHAMKRQIHAVRGFAEVTVPGHDVKLGRGGIREIEFFVQTQQLIFGGRRPEMRGRRTLDMLDQLAAGGWVTQNARTELTDAYVALRTIEHRLQMIGDEQTQRLPAEPDALYRFSRFCGFETTTLFSDWITAHFRRVENHYALLFEHAPGLDASVGDLVFTGTEDDPATIETLRALGYVRPTAVTETIRGWHFGHRPAVRSARAREVLTELVPALLQSWSRCGDPDAAVAAFDAALTRMPAATELFSVLRSNAALRVLFGDILGTAPRLASIVTSTPHVLDGVIDPQSFSSRFDETTFAADIATLSAIDNTEEFLDRCRLLARESQFVIGVRVLSGVVEPSEAGSAYSSLAVALVQASFNHVRTAFAREYGAVPGMQLAILALGKLGSREMTAASDLDLMVIYSVENDAAVSDGRRALPPSLYAARLTQRLVAALTAPTREGRLYEIDLRLRPWGTQGPLAVSADAFAAYHAREAETWERMALCRARPIAGDAALSDAISGTIGEILSRRHDDRLASEIIGMRRRIGDVKGDADRRDLKLFRGGLLDIEFIAQYLVLKNASTTPAMLRTATRDVLEAAKDADLIAADAAEGLLASHRFYTGIVQLERLALPAHTSGADNNAAIRKLIAGNGGAPNTSALEEDVERTAAFVRQTFVTVLGSSLDEVRPPAQEAGS